MAAVSTSARKYANVGLDLAYEPPPVLVRVNLRITVSLASSFDCTAILQWSGEPLITVCERSLSETTLLIRVNSSEVRSQSCGTYSLSIDAEIVISSLYRASTPFELIYIYIYMFGQTRQPLAVWSLGLNFALEAALRCQALPLVEAAIGASVFVL